MSIQVLAGDCRDLLRTLPDQSVNCVVTSPPYFGLRDYGTASWQGGNSECDHKHDNKHQAQGPNSARVGRQNVDIQRNENFRQTCGKCGAVRDDLQIGLEASPAAFTGALVEVFREVRRVLADDGTLWVNIGDSYNAHPGQRKSTDKVGQKQETNAGSNSIGSRNVAELKPKDLIGIPWSVAKALQAPFYTGRIKNELDRVWLAAMLDAEGSICGTEYMAGDRTKTNIFVSITNTSVPIIDKCERLFPQAVKHVYEKGGPSNRKCYRWDVERMETKALFIREIYPYLVAKRKQAIIGYTFLEMQRGLLSKKKGYLAEQHDQRSWLMATLSKLNAGEDVDLPGWLIEPPSLFEPGFYLRQDVIWSKPNPMPESVRDRCTKAHEYLFMFSKSPTYYFDQTAITEPATFGEPNSPESINSPYGQGFTRRAKSGNHNRKAASERGVPVDTGGKTSGAVAGSVPWEGDTRNKRSVWTVSTTPFMGEFCTACRTFFQGHDLRNLNLVETIEESGRRRKTRTCTCGASENWLSHFAVFPADLIAPCIAATCPPGGTVLDPFGGAGTTGLVADRLGRNAILLELNPDYAEMARQRIRGEAPLLVEQC